MSCSVRSPSSWRAGPDKKGRYGTGNASGARKALDAGRGVKSPPANPPGRPPLLFHSHIQAAEVGSSRQEVSGSIRLG